MYLYMCMCGYVHSTPRPIPTFCANPVVDNDIGANVCYTTTSVSSMSSLSFFTGCLKCPCRQKQEVFVDSISASSTVHYTNQRKGHGQRQMHSLSEITVGLERERERERTRPQICLHAFTVFLQIDTRVWNLNRPFITNGNIVLANTKTYLGK